MLHSPNPVSLEACYASEITILAARAWHAVENSLPFSRCDSSTAWALLSPGPRLARRPPLCLTNSLTQSHHVVMCYPRPSLDTPGSLLPAAVRSHLGPQTAIRYKAGEWPASKLLPWLAAAIPGPRSTPSLPPRCHPPLAGCSGAATPGQGWSPDPSRV